MTISSKSSITTLVYGDRWTAGSIISYVLSRRKHGESLRTKLVWDIETTVGRDILAIGK